MFCKQRPSAVGCGLSQRVDLGGVVLQAATLFRRHGLDDGGLPS